MQTLLVCVILAVWINVYLSDNDVECKDESPNCVDLIPSTLCQNKLQISKSKRPVPRVSNNAPRPKSPIKRPLHPANTKSRPVHRPIQSARPRTKTSAQKVRNARRPRSRVPPRNVPKGRRRPKKRKPTRSNGPKPNFVGPNKIKMPKDALPLSKLAETVTIISVLFQRSRLATNVILVRALLPMNNMSNQQSPSVIRVQSRLSVETTKDWASRTKQAHEYGQQVVEHFKSTKNKTEHVLPRIQEHMEDFKDRLNLVESLKSFHVDIKTIAEDLGRINKHVEPEMENLAKAIKLIDSAKSEAELTKIRVQYNNTAQIAEVLKHDFSVMGNRFGNLASSFKSTTDAVSKSSSDLPKAREPEKPKETLEIDKPKKEEPKKPEEPPKKPEPKPEEPTDFKDIVLQCLSKKYVTSNNQNNEGMTCFKIETTDLEHFRLGKFKGKVVLKNKEHRFCSVKEDSRVRCESEKPGNMELFERVDNADGTVSFKCANGKILSSQNGEKPMDCTGVQYEDWEKFKIVNDPAKPSN